MSFYDFIGRLIRVLLRLLSDCQVRGVEYVPPDGPLIVIANHLHNMDPLLLGAIMPRRITFMAKQELFEIPLFGYVVRRYGGFPVRRGSFDRQTIREAFGVLKADGVLGLFPEGHRSPDGLLQLGQAGAALIAVRSGAPVIPVAIHGTDSALRRVFRRPRVEVAIGRPFYLQVTGANSGREELQQLTDVMMRRIAELLPAEKRGRYQAGVLS